MNTLLLALLLAACGGESGPAYDRLGAYNNLGGSHRGNDYSRFGSSPASVLTVTEYAALPGGLLAPPLELPLGRMAIISKSDSATRLAVVYRDSVIWSYRFAADQHPMPGLAADSAGMLYTVTSRGLLKAFSPEGKHLWDQPAAVSAGDRIVIPSPPLALNDGVLVGSSTGSLARFDRSGKRLWSVQRAASLSDPFAADPALGVALSATHNSYEQIDTLLLIDPANGAMRWSAAAGGRIVQGPVIAGGLIVTCTATLDSNERRTPSVTAFTREGKIAWRAPLPLMPRGIAADGEGNIYISCSGAADEAVGGAMISLDSTGRRRWTKTFESGIPAPASVSADWVYFVSRREGRTGLFTYSRAGAFHDFVSIDLLPDVLAQMMITSFGELYLAGLDRPALLRGG